MILFEDFTTSKNIAGNCEETNVTHSKGETGCGLQISYYEGADLVTEVIFVDGCDIGPYGRYESLCYHAPEESYNLFNS